MYRKLIVLCCFFLFCASLSFTQDISVQAVSQTNDAHLIPTHERVALIVYVRDGCSVCKKQEEYMRDNADIQAHFDVQLRDIGIDTYRQEWDALVTNHALSKVTPITLVGGHVLVGFTEKTTGTKILAEKNNTRQYGLDYYLTEQKDISGDDGGYCAVDNSASCSLDLAGDTVAAGSMMTIMTLPFFGEINVRDTSLFAMSSILGFIDGFNPCAMWVLLTFLIILSQVGDKRKMIFLAGIFILAEGIMYFFILNVWYQTWDFITLDRFVTPAVGLLALGAGVYFLHKSYKSKGQLTCDVTSLEHQQKTTQKIKDAVSRPITLLTIISVLGIAFSVNIIEFACSVGIAQSFTKILEINDLGFLARQWFVFVYSFFYMLDDFLIFGLAIAGYQRFHMVGMKYSHASTVVGGVLMIAIGIVLIFFPQILVF